MIWNKVGVESPVAMASNHRPSIRVGKLGAIAQSKVPNKHISAAVKKIFCVSKRFMR